MSIIVTIALGVLGITIGLVVLFWNKTTISKFTTYSEEDFLKYFIDSKIPTVEILKLRTYIANSLNIPPSKLHPDQTFNEITKKLDLFGAMRLSVGDLEEEISDAFYRSGQKIPLARPSTIKDLIIQAFEVKDHLPCISKQCPTPKTSDPA